MDESKAINSAIEYYRLVEEYGIDQIDELEMIINEILDNIETGGTV